MKDGILTLHQVLTCCGMLFSTTDASSLSQASEIPHSSHCTMVYISAFQSGGRQGALKGALENWKEATDKNQINIFYI